ncbi:hypothetical protein ACWEWI_38670 [Streptomyces sp. NPDC003753]
MTTYPSSASSDGLLGSSLDCSIYVDSENRQGILRFVAQSIAGTIEKSDIVETPALKVYVAHNDYESDSADSSDVVAWPSVLECEQVPQTDEQTFVNAIGECLNGLWKAGFRAIAACDFEDRLPHTGGIGLYS